MKRKVLVMLLLNCTVVLFVGCSSSNTTINSSEKEWATTEASKHAEKSGHVDYDDQADWEFTSGKMQSPIDILGDKTEKMTPDNGTITLDYSKDITSVENNGHSIQVTGGGQAIINGRNFELSQFHFHAESEHTVDGEHYPIEAHFVNMSQDGRIAVIGVFFTEGTENKGFQEVLDDVNKEKPEPIKNLNDMIPTNKSYYHYLGSLTTPPLTENVEWYVMKNNIEVSPEQIESFKKLYSHNNRDIQPLNGRAIIEHNE